MKPTLRPLFAPKSIVVVGASDDATKYGGKCLHFLLTRGFRGKIHVIHPHAKLVQGIQSMRDFADLPELPDLAIIALPAQKAIRVLDDAGSAGIRSAIVFSSGFTEAGETSRQAELTDVALRHGIALLGPNTVGLIGGQASLVASFAGALSQEVPSPGNVALVSQSGALMGAIYAMGRERGLAISDAVSPGNEAVLGLQDFVAHFAIDPKVDVILTVLEGLRNGRAFRTACETAIANGKKVVVLKAGRSAIGSAMAFSHTASLTGEDAVFDALVARTGIVRVENLAELLDVGKALAIAGRPSASGVGVFTGSGGTGVLLADAAERIGVHLPILSKDVTEYLTEMLPTFASVGNPLDATAEVNRDLTCFIAAFKRFVAYEGFGAVIVARGEIEISRAVEFAHALVRARDAAQKPVLMVWLATTRLSEAVSILEQGGIPVFSDPTAAMAAAKALLASEGRDAPEAPTAPSNYLSSKTLAEKTSAWTESVAKEFLARHGFVIPRGRVVNSYEEALEAADEFAEPLAMKLLVQGLLHKSDVGGVRLAVPTAETGLVYSQLEKIARELPGQYKGVLLEEMVPTHTELILGLRLDPNMGLYATLAPGGVQAELFGTPLCALLPLGNRERRRLISQSAVWKLLQGFRGGMAVSHTTLDRAFDALELVAGELGPRLRELEVNPLVVSRDGTLVAADALVVMTV